VTEQDTKLSSTSKKRHPALIAAIVSVIALAGIGFGLYRLVEWLRPPPIEGPPPELRAEPGLQQFIPTTRRALLSRESPTPDEEEAPAVPLDHPFAKTKITGRVYDIETEDGIAGAIVRVRPTFGVPRLGPASGDGSVAYTTRSDGSYALKGVPPGTFDLEVSASGYAPVTSSFKKFTALEDDDGFDVGLLVGGSLEGRVITAAGQPVPKARVTASTSHGISINDKTVVVTTNDEGRFVLDPVLTKELRVMATHPTLGTKVVELGASEDPIREVEIVLDAATLIRGRVTDGSAPIAGATVQLALQRIDERVVAISPRDTRFAVTTGSDGAFELGIPPDAPGFILASAPGYEYGQTMVGEGENLTPEIVLRPAIQFGGRVVGSDGNPVFRAQVAIAGLKDRRPMDAWTDDQGRFLIDNVPKEGPYRVVIQHFEHPNLMVVEEMVGTAHTYELEAQGRILGVITDAATGGPVTRYEYAVAGPVRRSAGAVSISGSFEVDQLPAGNYSLSIDAEGYESTFIESIAVEAGQTVDNIPVRLKPAGSIVGRILGGRAGSIVVQAWEEEKRLEASGAVAEDGAFSLEDLPSGTYTITAISEGTDGELRGEARNVSVQSGAVTRNVEIALRPGSPNTP
jgi:hypothetical protein